MERFKSLETMINYNLGYVEGDQTGEIVVAIPPGSVIVYIENILREWLEYAIGSCKAAKYKGPINPHALIKIDGDGKEIKESDSKDFKGAPYVRPCSIFKAPMTEAEFLEFGKKHSREASQALYSLHSTGVKGDASEMQRRSSSSVENHRGILMQWKWIAQSL